MTRHEAKFVTFEPMRLEYEDWGLDCDVEATLNAYAEISAGGADTCTCSYCRNYRQLRDLVFPNAVQQFLAQLGVNWCREAEVVNYNREESGLHLYGGWFHFIGKIEKQGTQIQITDLLSISFSEEYAPMFAQFKETPAVRVDFLAYLPWVLKEEAESS